MDRKMRGNLIQRSEGSWSIVLYLDRDPITGKKRQKWHTYRGNKKGAEKELTRLVHEVNTGAYVEPAKLTVATYLERWLADYAKTNVSGKTFERYSEIVKKHLVPALGSVPLCQLKPLHIQGYYSQALQSGRAQRGKKKTAPRGLSAQTVLHHHRVLREALGRAVKWQLLIRNPADAVEPPKPPRREMHALNEAETAWLLEVVKGTRFYLPVLLAVTSGMRRGEFLGLRWRDVDLTSGTAAIRRSVEQTNEGVRFKSPKGRKGRPIALLPITLDGLKEHRELQYAQQKAIAEAYQNEDLICAREDGLLWKPDTFTADFARLAKKAGLKGVRLHDLRHSHATQLLINGVHPKVVSERLGHSSVGITLDIYSHVLPGLQEDAARKLDISLRAAIQKRQEVKPPEAGISKGLAN
jgi:integrase